MVPSISFAAPAVAWAGIQVLSVDSGSKAAGATPPVPDNPFFVEVVAAPSW
jgi:hypothetical protein